MDSGVLIKRAIKKHGIENFKKEILYSRIQYRETADDMERFAIAKERAIGKAEYNLTDGGTGGDVMSPETKLKMAEIRKKYSGENHPMYGKHHTEETKRKISESRKGKRKGIKRTEETKRKISESQRRDDVRKKKSESIKAAKTEMLAAYKKSGRKDWNTFQKEYKENKCGKKKIFNGIVSIAFILCLFGCIRNTKQLNKYRKHLDTAREQLIRAEEYNRELTERLGSISSNVHKLGELTERNVSGVRQCIEIIEETRVIVQELEDYCGSFSQCEYYQYWDNIYGLE